MVVTGDTTRDRKRCSDWTDITALGTTDGYIIGIREYGTVCIDDSILAETLSTWRDIAAIYEEDYCVMGVKTDGTLVYTERWLSKTSTLLDLSGWKLFDRSETLEEEQKAAQKAYEEEQARIRAQRKADLEDERA